MSEDLALSLLEELIDSQNNLLGEITDLTLQIELSDSIELMSPTSTYSGH